MVDYLKVPHFGLSALCTVPVAALATQWWAICWSAWPTVGQHWVSCNSGSGTWWVLKSQYLLNDWVDEWMNKLINDNVSPWAQQLCACSAKWKIDVYELIRLFHWLTSYHAGALSLSVFNRFLLIHLLAYLYWTHIIWPAPYEMQRPSGEYRACFEWTYSLIFWEFPTSHY